MFLIGPCRPDPTIWLANGPSETTVVRPRPFIHGPVCQSVRTYVVYTVIHQNPPSPQCPSQNIVCPKSVLGSRPSLVRQTAHLAVSSSSPVDGPSYVRLWSVSDGAPQTVRHPHRCPDGPPPPPPRGPSTDPLQRGVTGRRRRPVRRPPPGRPPPSSGRPDRPGPAARPWRPSAPAVVPAGDRTDRGGAGSEGGHGEGWGRADTGAAPDGVTEAHWNQLLHPRDGRGLPGLDRLHVVGSLGCPAPAGRLAVSVESRRGSQTVRMCPLRGAPGGLHPAALRRLAWSPRGQTNTDNLFCARAASARRRDRACARSAGRSR